MRVFTLRRPAHQQQVADILRDPQASENDKYVALHLRNSDTSRVIRVAHSPDTGVISLLPAQKGQRLTGGRVMKRRWLAAYITPIEDNLRYSAKRGAGYVQRVSIPVLTASADDLTASAGDEYKFRIAAKADRRIKLTLSGDKSALDAG